MNKLTALLAGVLVVTSAWSLPAQNRDYHNTVIATSNMVRDRTAEETAAKHGLKILNITWEDTGRFKNSSLGPNISDMTIQVEHESNRGKEVTCMPVIRYPNFSDRSADISAEKFYLLTGNEKGEKTEKVSLKDYLTNIRDYLSQPDSWAGDQKSLWAERDEHVLVSAQACFLPIPKSGNAVFNPVLFNYQSYKDNPAVLAIVATREGTSATVIDNNRDGFQSRGVWGQRLFFNHNGERSSLTGKRMSDFVNTDEGKEVMKKGTAQQKAGLNMVMLIQVPLKYKRAVRSYEYPCMESVMDAPAPNKKMRSRSSVENAVIGHGEVEGPFTEIDNLAIERDPAFPIRVTVQFYKATDNGVVNDLDMSEIAEQIERVYSEADYVGSLVTGGNTNRPTEYIGDKNEPKNWWKQFWRRHDKKSEDTPVFGW